RRLAGEQAMAWIIAFADRVADGAGELTDLDRRTGDGDFGWNLDTALGRARTGLAEIGADHPAQVFQAVSDAFLASGGTSGPLFGLWFGRVAHGPEAPWSVTDLATAFGVAADAVQRVGKRPWPRPKGPEPLKGWLPAEAEPAIWGTARPK